MKKSKNLGMVLLGIWLILTGLLPFLRVSIPNGNTLLPLLAVAAGVLILLQRQRSKPRAGGQFIRSVSPAVHGQQKK